MKEPGRDKRLSGIDEGFVKRGASSVDDADLDIVLTGTDSILAKFARGPLRNLLTDGKILFEMIKAYKNGEYRSIPWWVISSSVFALLYVFNPADVIPDFIPILGLVDDAFVVSICMKMVQTDIEKFRKFKESGR
jgi:uncharacterized membrane protein YkvA (DUF1232 family)